jgi:CRISPR/Cas system CMR-associated protein Cmr1 (group 7 of RAMP superfamily)
MANDCWSCESDDGISRAGRTTRWVIVEALFSGDAEPGQPDEDFSIRGTAIRGQLELWWRATRGTQFDIFSGSPTVKNPVPRR